MVAEFTATGGVRRRPGEPATYRLPEPHSEVTFLIEINPGDENELTVEYIGAPAAIVAAGVCAAELVGTWKSGCTRRDQDGDRALLDRRRDRTWVRLRLYSKSPENALKLPGVTLARILEEREAWRKACADPIAPQFGATATKTPTQRPHPHLRLIVDNTGTQPA